MKILMGYIFGAFLMTFGMFIFNMMIESIKDKEWPGTIIYFFMGALSFFVGLLDVLHMKRWI